MYRILIEEVLTGYTWSWNADEAITEKILAILIDEIGKPSLSKLTRTTTTFEDGSSVAWESE